VEARTRMTKKQTFASVWDALEDNAEDADDDAIECDDCDQRPGAQLEHDAGTGRAPAWHHAASPNDLLKGKINKFSLGTLTTLANARGSKGLDLYSVGPLKVARSALSRRRTWRRFSKRSWVETH